MQSRFSTIGGWLTICAATLAISGSIVAGIFYYRFLQGQRLNDPKFHIVAIAQSNVGAEVLHTVYLAELLDLSYDKPTSLYAFNEKESRGKLLASPLIKEAEIKKIKPGTLDISYTLRRPIAFLGDYSNTAFDQEGFLFPFKPFFTPKKLPAVFLGTEFPGWGNCLEGPHAKLALEVLQFSMLHLSTASVRLQQLDLSHAYDSSKGTRQILLRLEKRLDASQHSQHLLYIEPRILRLSTTNYQKELALYAKLSSYLDEDILKSSKGEEGGLIQRPEVIIDLRIPHLAYRYVP